MKKTPQSHSHPVPSSPSSPVLPQNEGEPGGVIRKSLVLSADLNAKIEQLQEGCGEGFSAVVRSILRIGLAAQENGVVFEDMVVLRNPAAGWLQEASRKLDMPAEVLLLRIVTEGLAKLLNESSQYEQAKQFLHNNLNQGGGGDQQQ